MTTRELSQVLSISNRTIQKHAMILGYTENGIVTNLNQEQVTEIKNRIGKQDLALSCKVESVTTDLEMIKKAQDFMQWATVKIQEETAKRIEAENKIALDAPKVDFFDAVTSSRDAIDMKDAAKVLNIGIGRNTLFQKLRDKSILMDNNTPYQTYIDQGYFRVIESKWVTPDGETRISFKTVVYQKGLNYLLKVIKKDIAKELTV